MCIAMASGRDRKVLTAQASLRAELGKEAHFNLRNGSLLPPSSWLSVEDAVARNTTAASFLKSDTADVLFRIFCFPQEG